MNSGSSDNKVTGYGWTTNQGPIPSTGMDLLATVSRLALGPTQPFPQYIQGAL